MSVIGNPEQQPSTEPHTLSVVFDSIDALSLDQGVCSMRVQNLIHAVHTAPISAGQPELEIRRPGDEIAEVITSANKLHDYSKGWKLFVTESGEPGKARQEIYIARKNLAEKWQGIRAFTLIESANENHCSVALCWLALEQSLGLNWSTVATSADEEREVTIDESLDEIPQTNADVLDQLINIAQTGQFPGRFAETLHLTELWEQTFPKPTSEGEFARLETQIPRSLLAHIIGDVSDWQQLSGGSFSVGKNVTDSAHLRYTQLGTSDVLVERVVTNRGTTEKATTIGKIVSSKSAGSMFQPEVNFEHLISDDVAEDILDGAEKAYGIPEMVEDPQLTKSINEMISELVDSVPLNEHSTEFNNRLKRLIYETWDRLGSHYPSDKVLRIGFVDLQKLGKGTYFRCDQRIGISAEVLANKDQDVFITDKGEQGPCLYDCSVTGANQAFYGVKKGSRLLAASCNKAFTVSSVTDSVAENVKAAFSGVGSRFSGCIAQSCSEAFIGGRGEGRITVSNSIAVNCNTAFAGISDLSRDLVAEFCDRSFYYNAVELYKELGVQFKFRRSERAAARLLEVNDLGMISPLKRSRARQRFGFIPDRLS